MIHQNLAGKPIALSGNPTASHGTPFAGHKNLRASTGTPFAKAGEPLASHGNADVRLGKGVAVRRMRTFLAVFLLKTAQFPSEPANHIEEVQGLGFLQEATRPLG